MIIKNTQKIRNKNKRNTNKNKGNKQSRGDGGSLSDVPPRKKLRRYSLTDEEEGGDGTDDIPTNTNTSSRKRRQRDNDSPSPRSQNPSKRRRKHPITNPYNSSPNAIPFQYPNDLGMLSSSSATTPMTFGMATHPPMHYATSYPTSYPMSSAPTKGEPRKVSKLQEDTLKTLQDLEEKAAKAPKWDGIAANETEQQLRNELIEAKAMLAVLAVQAKGLIDDAEFSRDAVDDFRERHDKMETEMVTMRQHYQWMVQLTQQRPAPNSRTDSIYICPDTNTDSMISLAKGPRKPGAPEPQAKIENDLNVLHYTHHHPDMTVEELWVGVTSSDSMSTCV